MVGGRPRGGGVARRGGKTAEFTLPGFRHDLFSAFTAGSACRLPTPSGVHLQNHGLRWRRSPVVLAHPLLDGRCASLSTEVGGAPPPRSICSVRAAATPGGPCTSAWQAIGEPFLSALFQPFPPVRAAAGPAADGSDRWVRSGSPVMPYSRPAAWWRNFVGEGGGLLLGGNALHADLCPEAAGSGMFGWLLSCLGQQEGFPVPGGRGRLSDRCPGGTPVARWHVRCDTAVIEVIVRGGRAVAVRTESGDVFDARRAVVAECGPTLFGPW